MPTKNRSVEQLVEEQLQKWNLRGTERKTRSVKPGASITISREPGCGGTEIAKRLSAELGMDLFGGRIIQKVAESAEISDKVIQSLDEKERTRRDDWLTSLFETRHLWPDRYIHHLTKVIGTIGRYGNAIIVGRGAHHILPRANTFRVRIIAPLEDRIRYVMEDRKCVRADAEQYIVKTENNRKAYMRKYFNADCADPSQYDILVNTGGTTIEGAAEAIKIAFKMRKNR